MLRAVRLADLNLPGLGAPRHLQAAATLVAIIAVGASATAITAMSLLRFRRLLLACRAGGKSGVFWPPAQVAASVGLLAVAGTLALAVAVIGRVPLGFDPVGVTTMAAVPRTVDAGVVASLDATLAALRATPGVRSAAVSSFVPLSGADGPPGQVLDIRGRAPVNVIVPNTSVSPGYFQTLGIPLLSGRAFGDRDNGGSEPVAVINRQLQLELWPGGDPDGSFLRLGGKGEPWRRVIGVVGDVRDTAPGLEPVAEVYIPLGQSQLRQDTVDLLVKSSMGVRAVGAAVHRAAGFAPVQVAFGAPRALSAVIRSTHEDAADLAALLGIAGVFAALLAMVGVYGAASQAAESGSKSAAVRIALGARRLSVARAVLGGFAWRALAGSAAGAVLGVWGSWTTRVLLHHVHPALVWPAASAAVGLMLCSLFAMLPAVLRLDRTDPATLLRRVDSH